MTVHKNDVYYADLSPVIGSEQGGTRPVLVIQNDTGNKVSPTIIVAAITSRQKKLKMPTHVRIKLEDGHLPKNSMAMLEQIRTIDKERLKNYVGRIDKQSAEAIERASLESLGIDVHKTYRRLYRIGNSLMRKTSVVVMQLTKWYENVTETAFCQPISSRKRAQNSVSTV